MRPESSVSTVIGGDLTWGKGQKEMGKGGDAGEAVRGARRGE